MRHVWCAIHFFLSSFSYSFLKKKTIHFLGWHLLFSTALTLISTQTLAQPACSPALPPITTTIDIGPIENPVTPPSPYLKRVRTPAITQSISCTLSSSTSSQFITRVGTENGQVKGESYCPTNIPGLFVQVNLVSGSVTVKESRGTSRSFPRINYSLCYPGSLGALMGPGTTTVEFNNASFEFIFIKSGEVQSGTQKMGEGTLNLGNPAFVIGSDFQGQAGTTPWLVVQAAPVPVTTKKPTCTIANQSLQINLATIDNVSLMSGKSNARTPFSLALSCDANAKVSLMIDGNKAGDNLLALNPQANTATGVGILLTRVDNGQIVSLGQALSVSTINAGGSLNLNFEASYQPINGQRIQAGAVNSSAVFTVTPL